jgi:hypothetical protein
LDGKISQEFWQRRQADWEAEEQRINARLAALKEPSKDNTLADVRSSRNVLILCTLRKSQPNRLNCCEIYFGTARSMA